MRMRPSLGAIGFATIGFATILIATPAEAGDASVGLRLAQSHCAPCHVVGRWQGEVFADAPPFAVIAQKFSRADLLGVLRGPHRKMNFRPSQAEATDIAEYIHSIAQ